MNKNNSMKNSNADPAEKQIEHKVDVAFHIIEIAKKIFGYSLIALGLIGLFVPFLQGFLLIIAGLLITGNHWVLDWIKKKLRKHYRKQYHEAHKFLKKRNIHILSIKKKPKNKSKK